MSRKSKRKNKIDRYSKAWLDPIIRGLEDVILGNNPNIVLQEFNGIKVILKPLLMYKRNSVTGTLFISKDKTRIEIWVSGTFTILPDIYKQYILNHEYGHYLDNMTNGELNYTQKEYRMKRYSLDKEIIDKEISADLYAASVIGVDNAINAMSNMYKYKPKQYRYQNKEIKIRIEALKYTRFWMINDDIQYQ